MVTLDGNAIVNSYGPQTKTFTVNFNADSSKVYTFSVKYFQQWGNAWIRAHYTFGGGSITIIPASWYTYYGCEIVNPKDPSLCVTAELTSQKYHMDTDVTEFCYHVAVDIAPECAVNSFSIADTSCTSAGSTGSAISPGDAGDFCVSYNGIASSQLQTATLTLPLNLNGNAEPQLLGAYCGVFQPCNGACSSI